MGPPRILIRYLELLRPRQYVKNGFVWLPLFFAGELQNIDAFLQTLFAFMAFCTASSSVYIFNDLMDVRYDRRHPEKRNRPIASGDIQFQGAVIVLFLAIVVTAVISFIVDSPLFPGIISAYLLLNLFYSLFLKKISIVDIACIAMGFVLRVISGGVAAGVMISHWIIIMTFLIALFLALAKRQDDLNLTANYDDVLRDSIAGYNAQFISSSMVVMASVIIVAYILYTVSPETVIKHNTDHLYTTSFWVICGILRYMQLTFVEGKSGAPEKLLIKDPFLLSVVILWIAHCYYLLYL